MPTYGFLPQGFVAKSASVIKTEIEAILKSSILGASAGTEPDGSIPLNSVAGELVAMLVDREAGFWDALQEGNAAGNPNTATGAALDAVAALTGTLREGAEESTVVETCTGTATTALPAGRIVSVPTSGNQFTSAADAVIAAVAAWPAATDVVAGQRVRNDTPSKIYQCITPGHTAGAGGPTGTAADIVDNTAHWKYIGLGTGAIDVPFGAVMTGPIGATAGTLTSIQTPVSGWSTATNLLDAAVGRDLESDGALRVRRMAEISGDGLATPDAIRAAILQVNETSTDANHLPILSCTVFHNDTDFTDGNGVPPHAVEVLVNYNGLASATTDQDIANAIFASVAAGIATYGSTTATVVDSQGNNQTVKWSKPTLVPIYISPSVFYDPKIWGSSALVQQAVISAILTFTARYFQVSYSVRSTPFVTASMSGPFALTTAGAAVIPAPDGSSPITGIVEVVPCYIGTAPGPASSSEIVLTARQLATFDSSRIVVTASSEVP